MAADASVVAFERSHVLVRAIIVAGTVLATACAGERPDSYALSEGDQQLITLGHEFQTCSAGFSIAAEQAQREGDAANAARFSELAEEEFDAAILIGRVVGLDPLTTFTAVEQGVQKRERQLRTAANQVKMTPCLDQPHMERIKRAKRLARSLGIS